MIYTQRIFRNLLVIFLLGGVLFFALPIHAAVPDFINFQSRLRNSKGTAIRDSTTIQFSIYTSATAGLPTDVPGSGGPLLWTESYSQGSGACRQISPDEEGYFTVQLSSCVAFPAYLDFNSTPLYIGVKVGTDLEALPRAEFGVTPFAANADLLDGIDSAQILRSDTSDAFTSGSLTFNDSTTLVIGTGTDLSITHNGTNSLLTSATGNLVFDNTNIIGATQFQLGTDTNATTFEILNDTGTALLAVDGNGNVGVGTSTPATRFEVAGGAVRFSDYGMGTYDVMGQAYLLAVQNDGDVIEVALGTGGGLDADRLDTLDSTQFLRSDSNDAYTSGTLTFNDSTILAIGTGNDLQITHDGSHSILTSATGNITIDNTNTTGATNFQLGTDTSATQVAVLNNTGTTLFKVEGGGNVGIGTSSPAAKFELVTEDSTDSAYYTKYLSDINGVKHRYRKARGTASSPLIVIEDDSSFNLIGQGYDGATFSSLGEIRMRVDGTPGASDMPGRLEFLTTPDGSNSAVVRLTIKETGNVGIGDTSPTALFVVGSGDLFQVDSSGRAFLPAGASGAGNLALSTTGDTNTGLYFSAADEIRIQTGGSDRVTVNSSGNVGIGTTSPRHILQIGESRYGTGSSGQDRKVSILGGNNMNASLKLVESGLASDIESGFQFVYNGTDNKLYLLHGTNSDFSSDADLPSTALTVDRASGNIGIGDTTPASLFTVGSGDLFQVNSSGAVTNSAGLTATTGNVAITAGVLTLNGVTRISNAGVGTFITGTTIGSQTFTTNNIADSGALTITSGTASALTLNSGTTGIINIGTDASAETINIGNTGAAVKVIAIGNNSQANTITIGDASATGVSITDNNWSVTASGVATFASLSLATDLPVSEGGTGASTFTTNGVLYGNAASAIGATAAGTTGQVFIATTSSAPSWGTVGALGITADSLDFTEFQDTLDLDAALTLNQTTNTWTQNFTGTTTTAKTITANSLTTGTAVSITSTSTAGGASGASYLLNLGRSGANAQLAHTAYGVYSTVTNTNATSGTNIAGYFSASGATTANYGLIVANGNVGIGTTSPGNPLVVTHSGTSNIATAAIYRTNTDSSAYGLLVQTGGTGASTYALRVNSNAGSTTGLIVMNDGSVGIGTTTPYGKLEISGGALGTTAGNEVELSRHSVTTSNAVSLRTFARRSSSGSDWTTADLYLTRLTDATNQAYMKFSDYDVSLGYWNGSSYQDNLYVDNNGNGVGIGTTSPSTVLHTMGNAYFQKTGDTPGSARGIQIVPGLFNEDQFIRGQNNSGASLNIVSKSTGTGNDVVGIELDPASGFMAFSTNSSGGVGAERVRIDNAGNVGIGTTIPGQDLHVYKSGTETVGLKVESADGVAAVIVDAFGTDMDSYIQFKLNASTGWSVGLDDSDSDNFKISNGAPGTATALTINSSGNVGIGTSAPKDDLQIKDTSTLFTTGSGTTEIFSIGRNTYYDGANFKRVIADNDSTLMQFGATGELSFWRQSDAGSTADSTITFTNSLFLSGAGNVGIGNETSPSVALDVIGDINYTGTITDVSDERLKENIVSISSPIERIMGLNAVSFNMIGDNRTNLGFTAQNVQDYFPEVVSIVEEDGQYLGVDYVQLIAPIVAVTQDQQILIEDLQIGFDKAFSVSGSYNGTGAVHITSFGKIGIGITTPGLKFEVADNASNEFVAKFTNTATDGNGIIVKAGPATNPTSTTKFTSYRDGSGNEVGSVSGNGAGGITFNTSGADYAEYFFTKDKNLSVGEVVCIDVANKSAVKRCLNASDGNVMGIISTAPAFLGNASKDKVGNPNYKIVAMLGQIPAKVSDENGPIRAGDSLTSASVPGLLMKANPGDSTVAVALEEGTNTIQVLISRKNKSLTVEQVETQVTERIASMEIEDEVNLLVAGAISAIDLDEDIKTALETELALREYATQASLNVLKERALALESNLSDLAVTVEDDISTLAVTVEGLALQNTALSDAIQSLNTEFMTKTLTVQEMADFEGTIRVRGHVTFNEDTVGRATILAGDREVRVEFTEEYEFEPIATVTPLVRTTSNYWITDEDTTGFTIRLSEVYTTDITFNWHAFATETVILHESKGRSESREEPVVEPVAEEPIVEEPVVEEVAPVEEPIVEEAPIEEPVAEEPVIEEPIVEEPIVEEVAPVEEPIVEEAPIEEPVVTEEPIVEETPPAPSTGSGPSAPPAV